MGGSTLPLKLFVPAVPKLSSACTQSEATAVANYVVGKPSDNFDFYDVMRALLEEDEDHLCFSADQSTGTGSYEIICAGIQKYFEEGEVQCLIRVAKVSVFDGE